ncbi:SseB family protein [Microbacterium sp. YY-01]|uniref:SseB family protein n=1 Tax=Microbacterium sp. YY-01 TaxID=3421634 RepID=UPI003D16FBE8
MALFSRRKKNATTPTPDDATAAPVTPQTEEPDAAPAAHNTGAGAGAVAGAGDAGPGAGADGAAGAGETPAAEPLPEGFGISVEAYRGVGAPSAPARPQVAPETRLGAENVGPRISSTKRELPLAPHDPPAQTETVEGMKDNVLLREALAQLTAEPTNEQLLGVLRQALQGHLYLRVHGDAREQLSSGEPLSIGVLREGERTFILAYSSAGSLRESVQRESNPEQTSAMAQPAQGVFRQVLDSDFSGVILDAASAPRRAVFPREVLERAMEQADPEFRLKALLAQPREADSIAKAVEIIGDSRLWVAVSDAQSEGQFGIAEAQMADGSRYLQLFTHPLEIVAMGRQERPMPFTADMIGRVMGSHDSLSGVIVDTAGPTMIIPRDALQTLIDSAAAAAEASGTENPGAADETV